MMHDCEDISISISFPSSWSCIMYDEDFVDFHYKILGSLNGVEKMKFIDDILTDYHEYVALGFPQQEQKQYRELLTKLVKDFGH